MYGPKTSTGWPATGLSLQVNNTITYDFVNRVQHNLPYNWVVPIVLAGGGPIWEEIMLPYNNSVAQTTGFTIPQTVVDNGVVLAYIRYFLGGPNDTATDAGMTAWIELPASFVTNYTINGVSAQAQVSLTSNFDDAGFYIYLSATSSNIAAGYAQNHIPAVIRVVEIPAAQINTITSLKPGAIPAQHGKLVTLN
jgi:hypothetical protein